MLIESIHNLWLRVKSLVRRRQLDRDLAEELAFHLAMREQKLVEQGMPPREAHYAARRGFGNVASLKETSREMWGFPLAETLLQDLRYGLRQLRRNPGFTVVAILTLALGIGGTTAIFTVLYDGLINPWPYKDIARLGKLMLEDRAHNQENWALISASEWLDFKEQNNVFSDVFGGTFENGVLTGSGPATQYFGGRISRWLAPSRVERIRAGAGAPVRVLKWPFSLQQKGAGCMAEIYPFRALHYNSTAIDLQKVVTQPYDKISPEMRARYYATSPYNFVRLILREADPKSKRSVYSEAAAELQNWIEERTLVSEGEPAIYPYFQEFAVPGEPGGASRRKQRRGFVALLRLEEYSAGVVHRHEETLSGPKADRMELLKATRCNFGQIFMLYSDPKGEIDQLLRKETQAAPWQGMTDEYSSLHSMWRVSDPRVLEQVIDAMRSRKLVIADGHHRYETSLAYARDRRHNAPEDDRANYIMATFVPLESDGLLILPTHRVVHSLPGFDWEKLGREAAPFFQVEKLVSSGEAARDARMIRQALEKSGRERPTIAAYAGAERAALFSLKNDADLAGTLGEFPETLRRLDVVLLHGLVLEKVMRIDRQAVREQKYLRYVRELEQAVEEVNAGQAQAAFLMNPTPIQAVCENAYAGLPLPQKSTDFYPKLLSGLTVYWMDNPAGL